MKQGRAGRDVMEGWKPKTTPNAISVKATSQLGTSIGNHVTGKGKVFNNTIRDIHAGRGFYSPLGSPGTPGVGGGRKIYGKGSQGCS